MDVNELVAGVDEAGRGPLAGPVVAAAVVLSSSQDPEVLRDSKTLTESRRELLYKDIVNQCTDWSVGQASVTEIERLNIRQATLLAMRRAVEGLRVHPQLVLVDGRDTPNINFPCHAIVGGDSLEPCISAASIIAKVTRDRMMSQLDLLYPEYGFAKHKGYGTAAHIDCLRRHGPCEHHRKTFDPVRRLLREADTRVEAE